MALAVRDVRSALVWQCLLLLVLLLFNWFMYELVAYWEGQRASIHPGALTRFVRRWLLLTQIFKHFLLLSQSMCFLALSIICPELFLA